MEQTSQGLAFAAATREAVVKKKRALQERGLAKEPAQKKRAARSLAPCQHEVAIPKGHVVTEKDEDKHGTIHAPEWHGEMAKRYPFQLDSFQAMSVACLERQESVLVAAHTSAGKTAVAEYAIAKALQSGQRVVYTSPLKALSNQKYRELSEEFNDVGLMTGDVSLNPNASCVVMTTEILRSMMYRGSELLREVSWVVFDEIHYMQDRERGVVWEEVIIFMPKEARMVFLSATLPNSLEFAEWVASVHGAPCHVVSTDYRPTPLVHYGFPLGGKGLYLLVDDKGKFRVDNFDAMKATLGEGQPLAKDGERKPKGNDQRKEKDSAKGKRDKKPQGPSLDKELDRLVRLIKEKKMEPVIVFSFSRRVCEAYARALAGPVRSNKGHGSGGPVSNAPLDFNTREEKAAVASIFDSALQCLSEEDRELSFIKSMRPMLQRGIGVHHSGLLPILKELVEILFQEQLIKCLFATETFAMGLNMPAKTVIFTQLKKWDGEQTRFLSSGEYIQMSGRAGRRGKDDRGYALLVADDSLEESTCKEMLRGSAMPLLSSFKLTYYTLLNLMRRVEGTGADMEYVISRSFSQFQHQKRVPEMMDRLKTVQADIKALDSTSEEDAREYLRVKKQADRAQVTVLRAMLQPERCVHFLRTGRIVRVAHGDTDWGYGVVVSVQRLDGSAPPSAPESYIVDTLLCCGTHGPNGQPAPASLEDPGASMQVVPVSLPLLTALSTLRVAIPKDLKDAEPRRAVLTTLREAVGRYPDKRLPELDPTDLGVKDASALEAAAAVRRARSRLAELSERCRDAPGGPGDEKPVGTNNIEDPLRQKARLLTEADSLERRMRASQLSTFQEESRARIDVLRKLGHISDEEVVTLKGRAASEVDTGDELLASELMFNGTFGSLNKHQLAALVSCLVPVEEARGDVTVQAELADPLRQLQDTARHIAEVSLECKLEIDADAYVEGFRATLMQVVHDWSKGASFKAITEVTDLFEGSIIRAMRRLDELMQNLQRAAGVVGDTKLAELFEASRDTLRRDLPFAASLYI